MARRLSRRGRESVQLEDDPLWYKDAIFYELHVRSFMDSNGDGVGDFRGLTERLGYLQDLGVTTLWLLPFYPSPLRDDGYDIADYADIHPAYGTMRDFRDFMREAHRLGLRVVTELVINHTSDQHPWFQKARRARPGTNARDFYVWSETPDSYRDARIIFRDFESSNWAWDPVARAYFWHRFYSHQPDLNFDNPRVHQALLQVLDFWMRTGVDGMRLDAIPYLYEREGTNCENLPETHAFLKKLRRHVDEKFKNRMLLAEANQWPEDTVPYFGQGDECQMAFHFPVMPRLFMAIRQEDRFPVIDIMRQTPQIPESSQWGVFLRNHDELTLEMVTDEERDYMYRVYASDPRARINLGIRRRLAPLLGNDRRTIELMNSLLFSMPGTPVLYYGDEIGMGDNIYLGDRNGVRTPMQWSGDRNAGFSRANPQSLYLPVITDPEYHYGAINVEAQEGNPNSLLWWMKRFIALRKRFKAFGRGTLEFLYPENRKVLAFVRRWEDETILVVANLSRLAQHVSLDLSEFQGLRPVELFGWTAFPRIGPEPIFLTMTPHAFYWFALSPVPEEERREAVAHRPRRKPITVVDGWEDVFRGRPRAEIERQLPAYLGPQRWFRGKARAIQAIHVRDAVPVTAAEADAYLCFVDVVYVEGESEEYVLPLAFVAGEAAETLAQQRPRAVVAQLRIESAGLDGVLYDAAVDARFSRALLDTLGNRRRLRGTEGDVATVAVHGLPRRVVNDESLAPSLMGAEQSNTSIRYGRRYVLKLFRRLEEGMNLELEVGRFLTERGFQHSPRVAGALEHRDEGGRVRTVAVLHEYVPNEGDAWEYTGGLLQEYFERVAALEAGPPRTAPTTGRLLAAGSEGPSELARDTIGVYLGDAALLGRRTAEMHAALASAPGDPDFAPEPFTPFYQRSLYQSMRNMVSQVWMLIDRSLPSLPDALRADARTLLSREDELLRRFHALTQDKIRGMRIRCHGDYHLGQVLYTGKDFVITDFEGEPSRALSERRLKRSALRDVAGMLRSFHYVAGGALQAGQRGGMLRRADAESLAAWGTFWYAEVSAAFLRAYLAESAGVGHLPEDEKSIQTLLDSYLLEKAVYEVAYELNNRPDWVGIPLHGALQLLGG